MLSMLLVSLAALLPLIPRVPASLPGGVNKATFDKIKSGMTSREIQPLIGRGKADNIFVSNPGGGYSESELWDDNHKRIWVEYEPDVANGKVTRATFQDFSTTPFARFELRR